MFDILVMGHGAWGMGHGAWGIGHLARSRSRRVGMGHGPNRPNRVLGISHWAWVKQVMGQTGHLPNRALKKINFFLLND
ncbi:MULTISPECIES: hypothetical protein [unclassified Microcoleus]|uniref:hypothetical protein n=1 Tax=unclassified Microcoleus TaxID=2642155 RepID=UPI002FD16ECA